jgi:hypothetical protein
VNVPNTLESSYFKRHAGRFAWPLGDTMRIIALFISFCALSQAAMFQAALAQTPECKSIANPTDRLACYDKASPTETSAAKAPGPKASKVDPSKYVDAISAEDARMNARLKSICHGC